MSSNACSERLVIHASGGTPRVSASTTRASSSWCRVCARITAPHITTRWSVRPSRSAGRSLAAISPSSHAVVCASCWNVSFSMSERRYLTLQWISPRTLSSPSACDSSTPASSRVFLCANTCPNCESANWCTPPLRPTEKFPVTPGSERKCSSWIAPDVGLNPDSGSSAVTRPAMQCPMGGFCGAASKSMGETPMGSVCP